jgi:hypothetical protein
MISAKLRFTCKSQENEEPTTGPEPLSCSRYEKEWLHFGLYVIVAKSCRMLVFPCSFYHPIFGITPGFLDQFVVSPDLEQSSIPIVESRLVMSVTVVMVPACSRPPHGIVFCILSRLLFRYFVGLRERLR